MGVVSTIGIDTFPKQGGDKGKRAEVLFHYDTSRTIQGTIVRDDIEEPFRTVIMLDDGRVILTTECQWHPIQDA